jgi:hypothetical protein
MLYQCFEQLLDLDLDQLRRRAGKKRRGRDERNLDHQGSLSGLVPCSLVECARLAQVLVMPVQAVVGLGGGTAIRRVG